MALCVNRASYKKFTDPFNEKVRARIFGTSTSYISTSSGSEHEAETDIISSSSPSSSTSSSSTSASPCLSYLVQNFLEDECTNTFSNAPTTFCDDTDSDSDSDSNDFLQSNPKKLINDVINPILRHNADPFAAQLAAHAARGAEILSIFRRNKSVFTRNLMAYLRELGYNAGVCKVRWDATAGGGLAAGNYEFIDVLLRRDHRSPPARYIVDADFSGEFEIARETQNYKCFRNSLPRVFVGKPDDVKKIVRLMCDEARRSMKNNGLTLAPWRKNRYMQLKWLGPYRRTTNVTEVPTAEVGSFPVKCRSVGFEIMV